MLLGHMGHFLCNQTTFYVMFTYTCVLCINSAPCNDGLLFQEQTRAMPHCGVNEYKVHVHVVSFHKQTNKGKETRKKTLKGLSMYKNKRNKSFQCHCLCSMEGVHVHSLA